MKSSKFAALAICGLLLASCGGKKEKSAGESLFEPIDYTLNVTNIEGNDSSYLYLYDFDALTGSSKPTAEALIDSVLILNGQAAFSVKGSTAPVAVLYHNGRAQSYIFPTAGENTFDFSEKKGSSEAAKRYTAYNDSISAVYEAVNANMPQKVSPEYEAFVDSVENLLNRITNDALDNNTDNAFGFYMASYIADSELEKADSIIALVPQFANTKRMKYIAEEAEKLKATSVGQPYTDFTIESNGKTVKLSDYVKPGEYTLVDFWASWCGPCKRAIASLKKNYDELHAKGLNIVGVGVWEDLEDTEAWLKENPLPWNLILDAQKVPTDIYAVKGIPTLILIGPDGKIMARSYSDEEVLAAFNAATTK